jgi:DNA invertase Pin-like site-specific DNA recombinase
MMVVGYVRVSTSEQADSRAGLLAQRRAIEAEAERRGWDLVQIYADEGVSGKSMNGRPGLQEALQAVESGEAEALVVSKLDRLSRSLLDFASLMERARKKDWSLVALDLGVDTSTPSGAMMASVLSAFAEYERRLIGQRTADALAVRRSQGVQLGRPREVPAAVIDRVQELRSSGLSVAAIARRLNADGVDTPRGGRWHSPGVKRVLSWSEAA